MDHSEYTPQNNTAVMQTQIVGQEPQSPQQVKDNRLQIVVDEKQVESFELAIVDSGVITDWQILLSRYLCNGNGPISPELQRIEKKPLRFLTTDEKETYINSESFAIVERQKMPQLMALVKAFGDGATAGF